MVQQTTAHDRSTSPISRLAGRSLTGRSFVDVIQTLPPEVLCQIPKRRAYLLPIDYLRSCRRTGRAPQDPSVRGLWRGRLRASRLLRPIPLQHASDVRVQCALEAIQPDQQDDSRESRAADQPSSADGGLHRWRERSFHPPGQPESGKMESGSARHRSSCDAGTAEGRAHGIVIVRVWRACTTKTDD